MAIKIMLAIPTLNRLDRLKETLDAVAEQTRQPDRVLIVNNGKQVSDAQFSEWSRTFAMDLFTPVANLGVAGSVNFAWRNTPPGWFYLHSNDDVLFDKGCFELLAAAAEEKPDAFIIPEHGAGSAFTVFLIQAERMAQRVGYFDEQFFPAYAEDNDLGRRMNIAGVERHIVPKAAYFHHTSSTLKAYTKEQERKHHDQFRANVQRYVDKWGGEMDKSETFTIPYDGIRGHTMENINQWHKQNLWRS